MSGIIRFYYDEKNEDDFDTITLDSFNIMIQDDKFFTISIKTNDKTYDFNLSSDERWQNNQQSMIGFLTQNLNKVSNGIISCKIRTFKERRYVYFEFYEDFDSHAVADGQFTGEYVEQTKGG